MISFFLSCNPFVFKILVTFGLKLFQMQHTYIHTYILYLVSHLRISLFPRNENTFVSKLKNGPLEKCWEVWGGGGGVTFELAGMFFHIYCLCRQLLFGCKLSARGMFFWERGAGAGIWRGNVVLLWS